MIFHRTTQNGVQFKTDELFISGILQLIFSDHSGPRATETAESKTADKRALLGLLVLALSWYQERNVAACVS